MTCEICEKAILGAEYHISFGKCGNCGNPAPYPHRVGKYVGRNDEGHHLFELTVVYFCSCGSRITGDLVRCKDATSKEERDVELEKFFNINQPHWLGKAP